MKDVAPNIEDIASGTCTRAGAFALLLTIALSSLIPLWWRRPYERALGKYIAARVNLALSLEELRDDPYWQLYEKEHNNAVSTSISQLQDAQVQLISTSSVATSGGRSARTGVSHSLPSPPTMLTATVTVPIEEMPLIAASLRNLNDSGTLTGSRRASNFFSFSILRWVEKRNYLAYQNLAGGKCHMNGDLFERKPWLTSAYYVPSLRPDVLLTCVTLEDVRKLSELEYPIISDNIDIGGHIAKEVSLSPGSFPHQDLLVASLSGQIFLAFVIMYFRAYTAESISSPAFPSPGTLFGAFSKSASSSITFLLALWAPVVVSLAIALVSLEELLFACTFLVVFAVGSTHRLLNSKSFFRDLKTPFPHLPKRAAHLHGA
jgi:hypothetical protein